MFNYRLLNLDTDSILINKYDNSTWSEQEQTEFLKALNDQFPELIKFDHDGVFQKIVILKAKNYALYDGKKLKIKGSALKDSKSPPIIKKFKQEIIDYFLNEKQSQLIHLYNQYVKLTFNIKDISPWAKKVTITDKIKQCKGHEILSKEEKKAKGIRKNESDVYDALKGRYVQEGDKIYVYFNVNGNLSMIEDWQIDYDQTALLKNLYGSIKIFKNVIDIEQFPNYTLKRNKKALESL